MKKSEKVKVIAQALHYRAEFKPEIERKPLKNLISENTGLSDAHTVNAWVDLLFAKKLISCSESLRKKPTNTTLYIINKEECRKVIK